MAIVRVIGGLAGKQAHGPDVSSESGQNLDGGKDGGLAVVAGKLQMEQPIGRPLNPSKYLDVGSAAGARIGHNIEAGQQNFSVGAHSHDAAALSTGFAGLRAIDCLRKMQVHFVDARLQRDGIAKLPLPASEVEIGILRAPDLLRRTLYSRTTIEPCIGIPQLAGMIDKAAA